MVLVLATGNPGKVRECAAVLTPAGYEVLGLEALQDQTPIEETGATFEANAKLKAEGYSRRTPHLVLADDSGLEVDALNGEPGVLSARYGGPGLTDDDRCTEVLRALASTPDGQRTARFRCVLAVAKDGRTLATYEGAVEGTILRAPRGTNGFGYDPIFFRAASGRSFAELTLAEKQAVSHRGIALRKLGDTPLFLTKLGYRFDKKKGSVPSEESR
jgi:XTP/dITP diphosphohydrolase